MGRRSSGRCPIGGADQAQFEAAVECRRASAAGPHSRAASVNFHLAFRTGVDILRGSPLDWFDAGAHLVHAGSGEFTYLHRNAIVTVFRMPPAVAIDSMPHMEQFFTDHDLERFGLGQIDATQIDENEMLAPARVKHIGAPDRSADPPADPCVIRLPIVGNPEIVGGKLKPVDKALQEWQYAVVVESEEHEEREPLWMQKMVRLAFAGTGRAAILPACRPSSESTAYE